MMVWGGGGKWKSIDYKIKKKNTIDNTQLSISGK